MNSIRAIQAAQALRTALATAESMGSGSFTLGDAVIAVAFYLEMRGGGRLDAQLDEQGRDALALIVGALIDVWLRQGMLEQLDDDRFRLASEETSAMMN